MLPKEIIVMKVDTLEAKGSSLADLQANKLLHLTCLGTNLFQNRKTIHEDVQILHHRCTKSGLQLHVLYEHHKEVEKFISKQKRKTKKNKPTSWLSEVDSWSF